MTEHRHNNNISVIDYILYKQGRVTTILVETLKTQWFPVKAVKVVIILGSILSKSYS